MKNYKGQLTYLVSEITFLASKLMSCTQPNDLDNETAVKIHGLKRELELNGSTGELKGYHSEKNRFEVQLYGTGKNILVRGENLKKHVSQAAQRQPFSAENLEKPVSQAAQRQPFSAVTTLGIFTTVTVLVAAACAASGVFSSGPK